ncbi:MAG: endonuclease/exonuclease/phosphatase family protein [Duncaniella sp.]|nr:endonuclease/exonuclease/phosphatase family protein [Duncaniella sp.]
MKIRSVLLLLAMVVALATSAQTDKKQFLTFGVAFYNLENLFDTINNNGKYDLEFSPNGSRQWTAQKYQCKLANLARTISSMTTPATPKGPAIIGVSEIENRSVLDDLVNQPALRKWNLQVVHHDSPDRRGVDVGLLYNPRQFQVIDVTNHLLSIPSNPRFRTRDQMCVTGILAGDTVSIIVNHWPSRLGGREESAYLRAAAAQLSAHIADSLWAIRPNQGVIIMGDLNDDPQDQSCAGVLGAQRETDNIGPHGFFNPWWKTLDNGTGTLAYKGQWNLFDQIIVSGTLLGRNDAGLRYSNCKVLDFHFLKNHQGYPLRTFASGKWLNGYSDHFPTEIFLVKEIK